jgi:hypothetical protein
MELENDKHERFCREYLIDLGWFGRGAAGGLLDAQRRRHRVRAPNKT